MNYMKMGRRLVLLGMTLLICSFIFGAVGVQAKKTTIEVDFVYGWDLIDHAEKMWETPSGIWHLRGSPHYGSVVSSDSCFDGSIIYLGNLNLFDDLMDPTTFNSVGWGTVEFTGKYNGEPVGFAGIVTLKIQNYYITGKFVCHGSGAFDGMLVKVAFEGWLGSTCEAQLVAH